MDVFLKFCVFITLTLLVFLVLTILHSLTTLAIHWTLTFLYSSTTQATRYTLAALPSYLTDLAFCWVSKGPYKMSTRKCCVRNCNKTRGEEILHKFPNPQNDLERFKIWVNSIGGDILFLDHNIIYRQYRVCRSHFDDKYQSCSGRVTQNAVPTLQLSGIRTLGRQSQQDLTNLTTYSRHSVNIDHHVDVPSTFREPTLTSRQPLSSLQPQTFSKGQNKNKFMTSEIVALKNKIKIIQKSKASVATRLKKALKLSENPTFQKALKKFSAAAMIFTMLQFREVGKAKMGRRFNKNEKVMALALYKQGPRAYRWLRKFFVLPSPLTLSSMIKRADLKPGINENIFNELEKRARKMTTTEKLCVLLFDEVAITPHFDYMRRSDSICGFVTQNQERKEEIADHALVFMIRGIQRNYKQPLVYTFCAATTGKIYLVQQIKTVISLLNKIDFKVIATICDQGATNVSSINWLVDENRRDCLRNNTLLRHHVFKVDGEEVVPLFDVPHLMKGIRNNLLNKNLRVTLNGKVVTAKWDHIRLLYEENPAYQGLRLLPKLTENHVHPQKIKKMKVKCATQVFSRTVAANMGYLAGVGVLPKECQETADVLIFFDNLFDSFNGNYENYKKNTGKPLIGAVTPSSPHRKVWFESKKILSSINFVDSAGKSATVPSVKNWLQTIENMEYIVDILFKKYHLTSLWMRHFNQDPLENFFGSIRSHGCRNNSPTCSGFEAAFASLLINNLSSVHSPGSNCEVDNCTMFKSLNYLFFRNPEVSNPTTEVNFEDINCDHIFVDINEKNNNPKIKAQLEYVTGYVLRKLNVEKCNICNESLYNKNRDNQALAFREYFKNKRCLTYPSHTLINCFSQIQDVVIRVLRKDPKKQNIKQYLKTVLSIVIDYSFLRCTEHRGNIISKLEDISINLFLFTWCKDTNKILNGCRVDYDKDCKIQLLCYEYCKKQKEIKISLATCVLLCVNIGYLYETLLRWKSKAIRI